MAGHDAQLFRGDILEQELRTNMGTEIGDIIIAAAGSNCLWCSGRMVTSTYSSALAL
jgi:hypothetical protein